MGSADRRRRARPGEQDPEVVRLAAEIATTGSVAAPARLARADRFRAPLLFGLFGLVLCLLAYLYVRPSRSTLLAIDATSGVVAVDPMCGERLVWDLPAGRVLRRGSLPGSDDTRTGDVTLTLLPGSRARVETAPGRGLRVAVSRIDAVQRLCGARGDVVYEATVAGVLLPADAAGVTYAALESGGSPISLLLSGHAVIGDAVQLGAGWAEGGSALLESGTVDVRIVPWLWDYRVTLRREELERGSLLDTHACLDRDRTTVACPSADAAPARGFLRTQDDGTMTVQLYTRGGVGTQSFGGDQYTIEVSTLMTALHSPILQALASALLTIVGLVKAGRESKEMVRRWMGRGTAAVVILAGAATVARAEPVEVRQGSYIGAGTTFRHGTSCLVVTARHVVPQMGATVTVLDRSGARAEGTRAYDNEFYDLALIALPEKSTVACKDTWPDTVWLARATFTSRNEFRAIRHYPGGRETVVRLQYAGGLRHQLTLAPVDRLTVRESDSGAMVELDGRPAGIVQSVDASTDRVNVLRFDMIDQLVGDRFKGGSAGPISFAGVLQHGRPNPAWSTYVESWLTEKAGRSVLPPVTSPTRAGARTTCEVKVDVLAWERVMVNNPGYSSVDLQLKACGKKGFLFEQTCAAGRRAQATTPRQIESQKVTINTTVTPPAGAPVSKLETSTHLPATKERQSRTEMEMTTLQAAVAPVLQDLLGRAACP